MGLGYLTNVLGATEFRPRPATPFDQIKPSQQEFKMTKSKKGKSTYLTVGFWLYKDGSIHLTGKGLKKFHVAISQDPAKRNGHPTLFKVLAENLRHGATSIS